MVVSLILPSTPFELIIYSTIVSCLSSPYLGTQHTVTELSLTANYVCVYSVVHDEVSIDFAHLNSSDAFVN